MDGTMVGMDRCGRCGTDVYQFSRKMAQSDGRYYCVKCAEAVDKGYITRNSCSVCGRLMGRRELKVVLPSMAYGEGQLPMADRLSCAECYKGLLTRTRVSRKVRPVARHIRESIRRGIAKSLMSKKPIVAAE